MNDNNNSRPSRARGLKLVLRDNSQNKCFASITGAWIETSKGATSVYWQTSRPSRARGLKRHLYLKLEQRHFASITGAWIETPAGRA